MTVILDDEVLEAPLVQVTMSGGAVPCLKMTHVGGGEPLHVRRKITSAVRPEHEMPVVPHQAEPEHPHLDAVGGFGQQIEKMPIVVGVVEQRAARVPAIENVMHDAVGRDSSDSRHEGDESG
jgi:hypothetical protein